MSEFVGVEGFPGYYISKEGVVLGVKGSPLTQSLNVDGYPVVYMRKDGKNCCKRVHRLLATAFIPNPNNYPVVNHKDGNKENYSLENLEWCTIQENVVHARDVLKVMKGNRTFSEDQIHPVCQLLQEGFSNQKIQEMTGVTIDVIVKVRKGHAWTEISRQYAFPERVGKILKSDILMIVDKLNEGKSVKEILSEMGKPEITVDVVKKIRSGRTYTDITKDILLPREKRSSTSRKA